MDTIETPAARPSNPELANSLFAVRVLVILVLTAAVAFMLGVFYAHSTNSPHDDSDFDVFWRSWDILEDDYYFDLPEDKELVYGAIQGLLSTTGDRYTFFVPPVVAEYDRQQTAGEFGGIGAYVSQNQAGQLVISNPFSGLPADEAGLKPGDIVLTVDNVSIEGWTLEDAVLLLRGEIGTSVLLSVYRPADDTRFEVAITRARVELPTASTDRFGDIGYVRLFSFNGKATETLEREIGEMLDDGIKSLILDLRGNPGGLLDQAVEVSDLFLDEGIVVTQRTRSGDEIVYRSENGQLAEDIPVVILMDNGSASASEVVAGALQDRDRAVIIGQTSYGKGSVQHVHDLNDESQLHVTTALWFTPNETPIEGQGLEPDIRVDEPEEPDSDQDLYLEAALAYFETEQ
ncbi:MAG: S41 family peptidase [Anaerolineae bacterium]|nr:S41 family peptidase [Anaerolineae bacterium]